MNTSDARRSSMIWWVSAGSLVVLLTLWYASPAGGRDPDADLSLLGLPPDMAHLLSRGDEASLASFCRAQGEATVRRGVVGLAAGVLHGTPAARATLLPHLRALAGVYAAEFDVGGGVILARTYAESSDQILDAVSLVVREREQLIVDPTLPDSTKVRRLLPLTEFLEQQGIHTHLAVFHASLAQLHAAQGDTARQRHHLVASLAASRRSDQAMMICQTLGELAQFHFEAGARDSADHYVELLERRAERSRIAVQLARSAMFRASHALADRRVGAAHRHLRDARRHCVALHAGDDELRVIAALADFYARLGCWRVVDRLAAQGDLLAATGGVAPDLPPLITLKLLQADARFHDGSREEARTLMDAAVALGTPRPYRAHYLRILHHQIAFTLADGRAADALALVQIALELARRDHLPELERSLLLREVEALWQLGQVSEAERRFASYRALPRPAGPDPRGDAAIEAWLEVQLANAVHGDGPTLLRALERALTLIDVTIVDRSFTAHDYLRLAAFDRLRWSIHDLVATEPQTGLQFDLAWRKLPAITSDQLRRAQAAPASATTTRQWIDAWSASINDMDAAGMREAVGRAGAHQLLYLVTGQQIIRWHLDATGCVREVVPLAPHHMRRMVADATRNLSRRPTAGSVFSAAPEHSDLAAALIPAALGDALEARQAHEPLKLLLSLDDALERLPFAALDLSSGPDYRPLGEAAIISYLRHVRPQLQAPATDSFTVVADPRPHAAFQRATPEMAPLPGARREARTILEHWPAAVLLEGGEATRRNLVERWERSERLYFASHVVRDPEAPYLSYLPMTPADDADAVSDAWLEVADVLDADLSGCYITVLAGCSSGAPYVEGGTVAPGLGEAFLDAGCMTVVQTLWEIDDDASAGFTAAFAAAVGDWSDPWDLAAAVRSAQLATGTNGAGHPYFWAAYRVFTTASFRPAP